MSAPQQRPCERLLWPCLPRPQPSMRAPRCAAQLPTAPAAACAPEAAGWGLGDLKAVADDVSRMISPLPAFQGAPQGSWRASRHFQGIARGPHSRAGPVSAVGSGWPRLPGLMVAVFSVKERLVQHIFAAPGALPCLIFRSCCCCWLPHRGRYCCLLFIRGLRCAQTARPFLAPHFPSAVRCVTRAHGCAGRWEAGSRFSHDRTSRAVSRLGGWTREQLMLSALAVQFEFCAAQLFIDTWLSGLEILASQRGICLSCLDSWRHMLPHRQEFEQMHASLKQTHATI